MFIAISSLLEKYRHRHPVKVCREALSALVFRCDNKALDGGGNVTGNFQSG